MSNALQAVSACHKCKEGIKFAASAGGVFWDGLLHTSSFQNPDKYCQFEAICKKNIFLPIVT